MPGLNPQVLVDKLTRLNNSQQSIETVSNWCTFYRKVSELDPVLGASANDAATYMELAVR